MSTLPADEDPAKPIRTTQNRRLNIGLACVPGFFVLAWLIESAVHPSRAGSYLPWIIGGIIVGVWPAYLARSSVTADPGQPAIIVRNRWRTWVIPWGALREVTTAQSRWQPGESRRTKGPWWESVALVTTCGEVVVCEGLRVYGNGGPDADRIRDRQAQVPPRRYGTSWGLASTESHLPWFRVGS